MFLLSVSTTRENLWILNLFGINVDDAKGKICVRHRQYLSCVS